MGYAEKNLAPGETILHRARYHWIFYRVPLLLFLLAVLLGIASFYATQKAPGEGVARPVGFLALGFAALAAVLFLARRIRASADEFVVTNRRVMRKTGLVAREIEQVPVEKIQDVTVEQGVLGRLLGYGTVLVETASERMGMLAFPDIARPEAFRNALWGRAADSGAATAAPAPAARSPKERLAELENLRQQGLVSQEEYAAKRTEILSHL
jgi:membrane protein YdbS with pleckstrin-like domain